MNKRVPYIRKAKIVKLHCSRSSYTRDGTETDFPIIIAPELYSWSYINNQLHALCVSSYAMCLKEIQSVLQWHVCGRLHSTQLL